MKKVLIIGGGMAGCIAAHLLENKGYDITLIEKDAFLGGGCRTFFYGGHPYTYGPRHFLTPDESIFEFFNSFVPMRRIDQEHVNLSFVPEDQRFFVFPPHMDDVEKMPEKDEVLKELENAGDVSRAGNFEDYIQGSLGSILYRKMFCTYSKKMWQVSSNTELDGIAWGLRSYAPKGMQVKTGTRAAWSDLISAFPLDINGYNDYFGIATKESRVLLNTSIEAYDMDQKRVKIDGQWQAFDIIISTISPDMLMNYAFGELFYMGRDFLKVVLPVKNALPEDVFFVYDAGNGPVTRIVEYKKLYNYTSDSTLLIVETPSRNNKLYPVPIQKYQNIADHYFDAMPDNVFSIGRSGSYKYLDVDDIYMQCRDILEQLN